MKPTTIFTIVAIAVTASAHHGNGGGGCIVPPDPNCGAPFCGCEPPGKRWLGGGPTTIPRRFIEYLSLPNEAKVPADAMKQ